MSRRKYSTHKHSADYIRRLSNPRYKPDTSYIYADPIDPYEDGWAIQPDTMPQGIDVYDITEPHTHETGILDSKGSMILYTVERNPIGFTAIIED